MKNLFYEIFSKDTKLSSKRVFGALCLLFSMFTIIVCLCSKPYGVIHDSILYVVIQFLTAGSALLGVTLFEKPSSSKK